VISELFSYLVQDLLHCYRRVDGFSSGGMLQATLETEFIHQSLKSYETAFISSTIKLIYETIEHNRIQTDTETPEMMQEMLEKTNNLITKARISTAAQFQCFREENSID
jgi:hypothetical protein